MEASGPTSPGALRPDDVPDVASAFEASGPFLSVVLTTEAAIPQASQRSQLRWQQLREQAVADGADAAALEAVDDIVPDAHHEGDALAVVASPFGVHAVDHGAEPPRRDEAHWSDLPRVGTILTWRQSRVPYLVANADRTGADLIVVGALDEPHVEIDHAGDRPGPVHKYGAGGWSHRRFQQRVENTWKQNAHDAAEHITRLVERHGTDVVIVTGEVRARELLDEALPDRLTQRVQYVDDARRGDGSIDERSPSIARCVSTAAAERTVALLRKFEEELGQHDRAVNGPEATIAALARAQADVLLVHDDPDDDRIAYYGTKPLELGATAEEVRALGAGGVRAGRLVDVLLRAAFGSGCGVRLVPHAGPLSGGVGALLRWSDS